MIQTILSRAEKHHRLIAAALLLLMFLLSYFTMLQDSAIVDEIAHIPAGYSYMDAHDYRLNPEHPPLIKDLSGLALLPLDLTFPYDHVSWTEDVNGQWEAGWHFIYHYGNNADLILFFARLPMLLLSILFGWLIYHYTKKHFGIRTSLLALFFYALSPNFIAHNHLVTTDLGIAVFTFLALVTFAEFLLKPSYRTLSFATLALAGVHLAKFSSVLLIPLYLLVIILVALFSKQYPKFKLWGSRRFKGKRSRNLYVYLGSYILMMAISLLIVWIVYIFHTFNMPAEKQVALIKTALWDPRSALLADVLTWMSGFAILKPLAQYLLGVSMVFTRVAGGNTTFFLGEVTNQSFKWYFPVSYLLKTPLPMLAMLVLAVTYSLRNTLAHPIKKWWALFRKTVTGRPVEFLFLLFIFYYAGISISGNLNLGIRHLFPILPLIYILVALAAVKYFESFKSFAGKLIVGVFLVIMLFWQFTGTLLAYPNYLSYHNEIIGGGQNAYRYFTDSNVDWGQDLKRFVSWLDEHPEIESVKLDYFGGGEPRYYLCKRKLDENGQLIRSASGYACEDTRYDRWQVDNGPTQGWLAVSVTYLQNARWYHELYGQPDYDWLREKEPYAKIGNSIFVYWIR